LRDQPVIVGGGVRGVVSTCCYIARIRGVRSAMPMFKALALCPEAVVVKPRMAVYAEVSREIRAMMESLTPAIEPLSLDEAFLDLSGTARLHGAPPAVLLAGLAKRIEVTLGITASVGLSHNKFLAKMASDMQKPRGFSVIGKAETLAILAERPVGAIWGVGKAMQERLAKQGIERISQLQGMELGDLMKRFGGMGQRLYYLSRGLDWRPVATGDEAKTISAETTFNEDLSAYTDLESELWRLCQKVSRRAKKSGFVGHAVTLKLKDTKFASRTRATSLRDASNMAHVLFEAGKQLLRHEADGTSFRLIGVGISRLEETQAAPAMTLDPKQDQLTKAELAMDTIRGKFGHAAVDKGLAFRSKSRKRK
jgi:DNA polymerase-4